jgi:hypothetical protein
MSEYHDMFRRYKADYQVLVLKKYIKKILYKTVKFVNNIGISSLTEIVN